MSAIHSTRSATTILAILLASASLCPSTVFAGCPTTPVDFGTECYGVCDFVEMDTADPLSVVWECNISDATTAGLAVVVSDYPGDHDFEAWGMFDNDTGKVFCCEVDNDTETPAPIEQIRIQGSPANDTLKFIWSSGTYNLVTRDSAPLEGVIMGGGGG